MRIFFCNLVLAMVVSTTALAQNQPEPARVRRQRADAAIADVVQGLFIAQFQEQVQVSDEQYVRILPMLRQGIETMRTSADRILRETNQLRIMLRRNTPDDQLNTQIQQLDEANRQSKAAQEAFLTKIDPFLNSQQRARFRLFQSTFDRRLREMVTRARQLNQLPPTPPDPQ